MEKLISMTDFVLEQSSILRHSGDSFNIKKYDYIIRSEYYAKFLKQPLELWMFVPCNKNNNVLEEPLHIELYEGDTYDIDCLEYQQAKERCLFKGFEITKDKYKSIEREFVYIPNTVKQVYRKLIYNTGEFNTFFFDYYEEFRVVEQLVKYDLTLTPTALKQIGL
jgi:hypothetical protein